MSQPSAKLSELYRETILANAVNPVGQNRKIAVTHQFEGNNPLCGDRILMQLNVADGVITDAAFEGEACAICLASTSLLCTHLPGQPMGAIKTGLEGFKSTLKGAEGDCPEYLRPMLGVGAYPARIACATLPWEAARSAVKGT